MLFPDVNVVLAAMRPDAYPEADDVRAWLEERLNSPEPVGFSELVLSAVVRISTHPRIFLRPSTPRQAVEFADVLLAAPAATVVRPGRRHWELFQDLVTTHRLRGNDVPDAYLASVALEVGATFVTRDRGFARFEKLRRLDPTS